MKTLLIGLDLSFNSTGICFTYINGDAAQEMTFYRVVFDNETNKTGKKYTPNNIKNINQVVYRMPTNIRLDDLVGNVSNKNNTEQLETTLRAMICSKKICTIIAETITKHSPEQIIITIENYIMPAFGGPNSLKNVSGLILLQGYVREFIIKWKITNPGINIILYTPTPSENKKSFCNNGKAEKYQMLECFVNEYEGTKLIPDVNHGKLDDCIDAFSLMCFGYKNYLGY